MELYFNYKRSCSDVHELRHTTLVHNCHLSVTAGVRLSQTDSEPESGVCPADSGADLCDCQ